MYENTELLTVDVDASLNRKYPFESELFKKLSSETTHLEMSDQKSPGYSPVQELPEKKQLMLSLPCDILTRQKNNLSFIKTR